MKKLYVILLSFAIICSLFTTAVSATTSGITKIINGNTYVYPNGLDNVSNNDISIIKPYTNEQIRQAEEALEPAFKSFYLSDDKALCTTITSDKSFEIICNNFKVTTDLSSLFAAQIINMSSFSKVKLVGDVINTPEEIRYQSLMKNEQGIYTGLISYSRSSDGNTYESNGYMEFKSAYITYDLRTHAVELYSLLKDSGLDFQKTIAKLFACEAGQYFYFSDGTSEFVTPIGMQPEFSPYTTGAGYPDASASFHLIKGQDFLKAMTEADQKIKAAYSSSTGLPSISQSAESSMTTKPSSSQQQPTSSQNYAEEIVVINDNTYIYPNGFVDTPHSDIIIIKPYSEDQIRQAEEALEPIFQSYYLLNDKALCDAVITDDFNQNCQYENWTADFTTLCAMSGFDSIIVFPMTESVSEALSKQPKTYYRMLTKSTNGGYGGDLFIHDDFTFGYGLFTSAYITEDLRTHAVALYALLKDSDLDLLKTTAKFFQIGDVGRFLLFSDGNSEFVTPIGFQLDYSPYKAGEGQPDASAVFQLICGEDFMKAMVKVKQQYNDDLTVNAIYSGEPQMGGNTTSDDLAAANDNTILFIAIGCSAIAAASVVVYIVIRKKHSSRKV